MLGQLLPKLLFPGLLAAAMAMPQGADGCNCGGNSRGAGGGCNCSMNMNMGKADSSSTASSMQMPTAGDTSASAGASVAESYGGQKTCPVSGKALGSMGKPIAVEVKGKTIYVCCKGCVAKVKANPDDYLAKVQKELEKK
jgi:YHS domain-containing protein